MDYIRNMSEYLKMFAKHNLYQHKHHYKISNDHASAHLSLKLRLIWALKLVHQNLTCLEYETLIEHADLLLRPGVMHQVIQVPTASVGCFCTLIVKSRVNVDNPSTLADLAKFIKYGNNSIHFWHTMLQLQCDGQQIEATTATKVLQVASDGDFGVLCATWKCKLAHATAAVESQLHLKQTRLANYWYLSNSKACAHPEVTVAGDLQDLCAALKEV